MAYPSGFSREVVAAVAQLLGSLSSDAASVLAQKHLGRRPQGSSMTLLLLDIESADRDSLRRLVVELFTRATRATAPTKYLYEDRAADLRAWLLHDGWQVEDGRLVAVAPAVEETTALRDQLMELLESSGVDGDGAVRRLLDESAAEFRADPPDVTSSTTKVRVAMETIGRRGARLVARRASVAPPADAWGPALDFLRKQDVVTRSEEVGIAASYTFISDAAHVPKGLTDVEWARISRTIVLSIAYFLLRALAAHR